MSPKSFLVFGVFVCVCLANELNAEVEEIHAKLFGDDSKPIEVGEILDLLNHLALISKDGYGENNQPDRSEQVNALIEASVISADKCDDILLLERWSLLEYHSNYKVNILPYLKHFWTEQFEKCNKVYTHIIREGVKGLDASLVEFATDLRDNVAKVDSKHLDLALAGPFILVPRDSYRDAILAIMEQRVGPDTKFKQNKITGTASDFANELESIVKKPCRQIQTALERPTLKNYATFLYHKDLAARIDPFALEWIKNVQICKKITLAGIQLTLDAHQNLMSRKQPGFKQKSNLRFLFARN